MKYIALCDIADTELYFAGFINEQIITTNKEFLNKVSTETGIIHFAPWNCQGAGAMSMKAMTYIER